MTQATFRLLASTTHLGSVRVKTLVTSRIFNERQTGFSARRFQMSVHRYPRVAGGASRDRTGDPLLAKQVLSQLSYGPIGVVRSAAARMVGLGGLEPPASPLSGVRSNHLSYRPNSRSMPCTAIFIRRERCLRVDTGALCGRLAGEKLLERR